MLMYGQLPSYAILHDLYHVRPIPVMAEAKNAIGNSRSMRNDVRLFILRSKTVLSSLKNTPLGQVFIHLRHPMQASAFSNTTCLCKKKPVLPITCFGHFSTHSQHAMHKCGFIATYAVVILFIAFTFFCKVKWRLYLDYSRFLALNALGLIPVVCVNTREK